MRPLARRVLLAARHDDFHATVAAAALAIAGREVHHIDPTVAGARPFRTSAAYGLHTDVSRIHANIEHTCYDRNCEASSPGLKTPRSVMMPVINSAGVTSKAGL